MPVTINGKTVKNGRKPWIPPPMPLNDSSAADYLKAQEVVDQSIAGKISHVTKLYLEGDVENVTKESALRFASINHEVIGGPRILAWLLKIEELGMQGNLKAFEILLDRCFGKVTETIAVAHGEFEGMKDGELLKELQSIKGLYSPKPTDNS